MINIFFYFKACRRHAPIQETCVGDYMCSWSRAPAGRAWARWVLCYLLDLWQEASELQARKATHSDNHLVISTVFLPFSVKILDQPQAAFQTPSPFNQSSKGSKTRRTNPPCWSSFWSLEHQLPVLIWWEGLAPAPQIGEVTSWPVYRLNPYLWPLVHVTESHSQTTAFCHY